MTDATALSIVGTVVCKLPFILARKAIRLRAKSPKLAEANGKAKDKSSRRWRSASASGLSHEDGGLYLRSY